MSLALSAGDPCTLPITPIDPAIDAALHSIEAAGTPKSMTADIVYRKDEALLGRHELRLGSVVFHRDGDKEPVLGVHFPFRVIGARRESHSKRIIFRDGWLIEIDEPRRLTIKRQLAAEGKAMDPMRLGGPFPLPLGQTRASVLMRFAPTEAPPPAHPLFKPVASTANLIGIRLTPHQGIPEADAWSRIDLWYDPATWLPVAVEAHEPNGDVRRIRLTSHTRDAPLSDAHKKLLIDTPPDEDWTTDVHPLLPPDDSP